MLQRADTRYWGINRDGRTRAGHIVLLSRAPPELTTTVPGALTAPPPPSSVTLPLPETEMSEADYQPRFEPTQCGFAITLDLPHHCGYLIVPEDRRRPAGPEVRLPVIVFEAQADDPLPDPVIYLAGGGGVEQMGMMGWYRDIVIDVTATRDFVMYNQRGRHSPILRSTARGTTRSYGNWLPNAQRRSSVSLFRWRSGGSAGLP